MACSLDSERPKSLQWEESSFMNHALKNRPWTLLWDRRWVLLAGIHISVFALSSGFERDIVLLLVHQWTVRSLKLICHWVSRDSQPRPWAPHYTGWRGLVYRKDTYEEPVVVDDDPVVVDEATVQASKGRSRSRTPPRTPLSSDGKTCDPPASTEGTTADIEAKTGDPLPKIAAEK